MPKRPPPTQHDDAQESNLRSRHCAEVLDALVDICRQLERLQPPGPARLGCQDASRAIRLAAMQIRQREGRG